MCGKVVLLAPNHLARLAASRLKLRNLAQGALFPTVAHLMSQRANPLRECRCLFPV